MRRLLRTIRQFMLRLGRRIGRLVNYLTRFLVNGIAITTVRGPAPTVCGGFDWRVTFTLARASTAGGWIVQRVDEDRDIYDCNSTPNDVQTRPSFWEAWEVKAGKRIDHERDRGHFNFDDQYNEADHPHTEGSIYIRGTVRFFEGVALPPGMIPNNPNTPAGSLPSTRIQPPFFSTFGATFHDLLAIWNCCRHPARATRIFRLPTRGRPAEPTESESPEETEVPTPTPEIEALIATIAAVPAWTEGPYDEQKVEKLTAAAEQCKEASPENLRSAIESYYLQNRTGDNPTRDLSRVYLLLRVVFKVPLTIDRTEAKVFGGWNHPSVFSSEPTFRLLWPVRVSDDGVVAVEGVFSSYRGRPYDALGEHDYFKEKFGRRD